MSPSNPVLATSPSRQCPDRSPTGNQIFLFFFYVIYILCSHFYVGSMYDEIRLHVAWSYNASADSSFSLIPSFTLSNHLLLGLSPNFFAPLIRSFLCPVYQCRPYQRHVCLPVDRQVHFPVAQHSRHFLPVFPPALHNFAKKQSRLHVRKYSFSERTINVWNKLGLSTDCVHASRVVFKNRVSRKGGLHLE